MLLVATLTVAGLAQAGPQPPAEPQRLRVVVAQHLEPGDEPVPGLLVELGALAANEELEPPGTQPVLATLALDAQGRGEHELELAPLARAERLWARVASPGYQRWQAVTTFDPGQARVSFRLPGRRGGTLHGTITPPGPSGQARIRLLATGSGERGGVSLASSGLDGRFHVHFAAAGSHHLQVAWGGRMAVLRDLVLAPLAEPRTLAVELAPGLALAGRLLDPDGVPLHALLVSALPADLLPLAAETPERAWSDGHYGERVVTDPEGRFRFAGLPPGPCVLIGAFDGAPEPLVAELFPAGTMDLRVEARLHRLRVRVRDSRGESVDLSTTRVHAFSRLPGAPLLALEPRGGARERGILPFPAEVLRAVEPGDELRLAYLAPRTPLTERVVVIPERPYLVEEELRLPPPVEPARVRLRTTAEGRPLGGVVFLALLGPDGLELGRSGVPGPEELELPPGTYWLRAHQALGLFCDIGDPEELVPRLAFAQTELHLAPGEQRALELAARPNAGLRVVLPGPARGTAAEIEAGLSARDFREALRAPLAAARLELHPPGGGPALVPEFSIPLPEHEVRRVTAPWVAPGRECLCLSALVPGTYRVAATLTDGRVLERTIELERGRGALLELGP